MRSRGEGRGTLLPSLERALRGIALLGLIWLTWGAFTETRPAGSVSIDEVSRRALADWSARPSAETLHVALRSWPAPEERDWLRALAGAGNTVTWSHDGLPATALELAPVPGPGAEVMARVAAPRGRTVLLSDSLGAVDSVTVTGSGAAIRAAAPVGRMSASVDDHVATAARPGEWTPRRAVVLGSVGWEAKFVVAALEEKGWVVDAQLAVAPDIAVTQGRPFPLDTARHAVVIALDSTAADAGRAIAAFVGTGGGVVLGSDALIGADLRGLAPGGRGAPVRPAVLAFAGVDPRRALAFAPVTSLRDDAVPLENRDGRVTVAARRAGAGRALLFGYSDTWRWRMTGGDAGPAEHRAWWSALVSSAAHAGEETATGGGDDPAPFAGLVAAIGPPATGPPSGRRAPRHTAPIVLGVVLVALFGEWLSRRLRGAA
jgi:hypothetical protein